MASALSKMDIQSVVAVSHNAAVAIVELPGGTQFTGSAKRSPGDRFDTDVAINLALGRAFAQASDHLIRNALKREHVLNGCA